MNHSSRPARNIAMLSIHSSPTGALGTKNTGGMSVYIQALACHLGDGGHLVDIYTCIPGRNTIEIIGPNVRLIHLFSSRENLEKEHLSGQVNLIFQRIEKIRCSLGMDYGIIHSHYWISGLVGVLAQYTWCRPHIIMFHTMGLLKNMLSGGENESKERINHERRLTREVNRIIVPTEQERDHLLNHYQADPVTISVVPCGVDLDFFQPLDKSKARRWLGIPESAEVLLYVGRFTPLKGLDRLIEAVAEIKRSGHPAIELLIVGGDGPDADNTRVLQNLIVRHHLEKNIHFAGRIIHEELLHYYAAADLMVLPSQYESFGLVVLEALACGLPVAATPVGAAKEVVRWSQNGILFNSPHTADIVTGLERLLGWLHSRAVSRHQVRDCVMNFGWDRICGLVAREYDLILDGCNNDHDMEVSVNC